YIDVEKSHYGCPESAQTLRDAGLKRWGAREMPEGAISRAKLVMFSSVMALIPILALVILTLGYYAIGKLTYAVYHCSSFAKLDDEIGWTLIPSTKSCTVNRDSFSAAAASPEISVFTDANGARSASPGGPSPTGGILIVGGSHTFGAGVGFEATFAGIL